jgi:hypothetical protein
MLTYRPESVYVTTRHDAAARACVCVCVFTSRLPSQSPIRVTTPITTPIPVFARQPDAHLETAGVAHLHETAGAWNPAHLLPAAGSLDVSGPQRTCQAPSGRVRPPADVSGPQRTCQAPSGRVRPQRTCQAPSAANPLWAGGLTRPRSST